MGVKVHQKVYVRILESLEAIDTPRRAKTSGGLASSTLCCLAAFPVHSCLPAFGPLAILYTTDSS